MKRGFAAFNFNSSFRSSSDASRAFCQQHLPNQQTMPTAAPSEPATDFNVYNDTDLRSIMVLYPDCTDVNIHGSDLSAMSKPAQGAISRGVLVMRPRSFLHLRAPVRQIQNGALVFVHRPIAQLAQESRVLNSPDTRFPRTRRCRFCF
jgi:hypothetical protein